MENISKTLVKQYKYWGVYVHGNQSYLGRCVIWCDREDAVHITDATKDEYDELLVILKEMKVVSEKAFGGEWFNFSFLGNNTKHLHCHFIPRYSGDREFAGVVFKDDRWGHHYKKQSDNFVTTAETLEKVCLELRVVLDEVVC